MGKSKRENAAVQIDFIRPGSNSIRLSRDGRSARTASSGLTARHDARERALSLGQRQATQIRAIDREHIKAIAPKQGRFVDKNRVTKAKRHTHIGCRKAEASE